MKSGNDKSQQGSELRGDEQQLGQREQTSAGGQQEQSRSGQQQEQLGQQSNLEEKQQGPKENKQLDLDLDEE